MLFAEKYLVSVWNGVRATASTETFYELHMKMHMNSAVVSLGKLPPTSSVIKEHLKHGFAVVHRSLTFTDPNKKVFNPIDNG